MSILIVDDSLDSRLLLEAQLRNKGYNKILLAASANEAYKLLDDQVELILMDIMMPDIDGITACLTIHENPRFHDIPIIMVTANDKPEMIHTALESGAIDYIRKPFDKIELLARIRSALRLKHEIDQRKEREQQLIELTKKLQCMSSSDGLTGIANRRHFDEYLATEWRRALRKQSGISLIMIDIDFFKLFNDTYGHLRGDECLKKVAQCIRESTRRAGDLAARYGGEEFAIILPEEGEEDAYQLASIIRENVEGLKIPHQQSEVSNYVTVSLGVASMVPQQDTGIQTLIDRADGALYKAKRSGRNRVCKAGGWRESFS